MAATISQSRPRVQYDDLRGYLKLLEQAGLLTRVTAEVDPKYEIGAICARALDRGGPGILFENVKGYPGMPLVSNIMYNVEQLAIAFGMEPDENKIYERAVQGLENRLPSEIVATGPCKEAIVSGDAVDISMFPTPWWHELDGGQFIGTTGGCVTRDPNTGFHNMGSYRVMIKSKNELSFSIGGRPGGGSSKGGPGDPCGADHILANEKRGLPTPIALVLGMDPLLTLASGSAAPIDGNGYAEYEVAGGWRGAPTQLVKCETSDLLVPANAEIIVEGEVPPGVRTHEGPHGESTGFYGESSSAFLATITCITYRKNPISYGLICRIFEDYPRTILRSGSYQSFLAERSGLDNITQVYMPEIGRVAMCIVAAKITSPDQPKKIMDATWEHIRARWVIVVDDDCDVRNWNDVMWRVCAAAEPTKGEVIMGPELRVRARGTDMDFVPPLCGMGIDATMQCKDAKFPPVNVVGRELMANVAARWRELGLP